MKENEQQVGPGGKIVRCAMLGVVLGAIFALAAFFVIREKMSRSKYDVTAENGFAGNPEGVAFPILAGQVDASAVYDKVKGSVITIIAYEASFDGETGYGFGSGVCFRKDEAGFYFLTNAHVVEGNFVEVHAYFAGEAEIPVKVLGMSSADDVAVVFLDARKLSPKIRTGIRVAELGDSDLLRVGDFVLTLGTPSDLAYSETVTVGVVSGLDRSLSVEGHERLYLQMDAVLNPGNSGGALFNADGLLVGINSAKIIRDGIENISYALPINRFMEVAESIITMAQ